MAAAQILGICIQLAAAAYGLPPLALQGIYKVEGGQIGLAKPNTDDSEDLGPFQINTRWIPTLRAYWGLGSDEVTRHLLINDTCANTQAAAAILRSHWDRAQDLRTAIGWYHSKTPEYTAYYIDCFERRMAGGSCPPHPALAKSKKKPAKKPLDKAPTS